MSDLVNRKTLIGAIEKCGEEKIYPQALIETIQALPSADRQTEKSCRDCPIYSADRPKVNSNSAKDLVAEKEKSIEQFLTLLTINALSKEEDDGNL